LAVVLYLVKKVSNIREKERIARKAIGFLIEFLDRNLLLRISSDHSSQTLEWDRWILSYKCLDYGSRNQQNQNLIWL
jgi:hypothetical protein